MRSFRGVVTTLKSYTIVISSIQGWQYHYHITDQSISITASLTIPGMLSVNNMPTVKPLMCFGWHIMYLMSALKWLLPYKSYISMQEENTLTILDMYILWGTFFEGYRFCEKGKSTICGNYFQGLTFFSAGRHL